MNYPRKTNGQFKSKGYLKKGLLLGLIMFIVAVPLFHKDVMAMIDNLSSEVDTKYVAVTAEVKPNCTNSEMMYTEKCLLRVTNEVAKTLAELVEQEKVVETENAILETKRSAFNQAAFNLETIAN